ncbi:unnamed protein product, partial [Mesorhabditis belari]|uniref:Uncharacterized protein n=1 Tax=Mesorhabditis belari TaxID=2138241 RepID=A0AAF3FJ37_9BILA
MRTILVIAVIAFLAVNAKKQKGQNVERPMKVEQMPCPYMREQAMAQMDPLSRANAEYQICKQNCLMKHQHQQMQTTTEQKVDQLRKELADAEAFLQQMGQAEGQDGHQQLQDGHDQQTGFGHHPAGVHQSSQMSDNQRQAAKPHSINHGSGPSHPADYKI